MCIYESMPESNFAEKIIKIRRIYNLERKDLAKMLGLHLDTIVKWESGIMQPKPENIKVLCNNYNYDLSYFGNYYNTYYNNPSLKIRIWKDKNNYTYSQCCSILKITHSFLGRLLNNKVTLSYDMYLKLKEVGAL